MANFVKGAGDLAGMGIKRGFSGGFQDVVRRMTAEQLENLLSIVAGEISSRVSRRRNRGLARKSRRTSSKVDSDDKPPQRRKRRAPRKSQRRRS